MQVVKNKINKIFWVMFYTFFTSEKQKIFIMQCHEHQLLQKILNNFKDIYNP
ncbi:hypothetical protein NUSPORA_01693 [Nucleospora cyclopteri]